MRVGVVCEGPTDWHAIVCFLEASLTDRGIAPVFVEIQPEMDKTNRANGGWGRCIELAEAKSTRIKDAELFQWRLV